MTSSVIVTCTYPFTADDNHLQKSTIMSSAMSLYRSPGHDINPSFTNFVKKNDQEITSNFCVHYAGGPRRPPPPQLEFRRSRDLAHASIPLAQTPWGLTGRAWLQAGAQQAVIAVVPSFNSLGIDCRNVVRLLYPVFAHNLIMIHFISFEELCYVDCQDVAQYTLLFKSNGIFFCNVKKW